MSLLGLPSTLWHIKYENGTTTEIIDDSPILEIKERMEKLSGKKVIKIWKEKENV